MKPNGVIAWFARNGVAANLLLLVVVVGGLLSLGRIRKEIFPEFSSDMITVSVAYRGASPEEVEEAVCIRIEEALQGLDGIKRIRSVANENLGTVVVELLPGADTRRLLNDIKARVDAIDTFPAETEKPVVQELILRSQVINVAVSGDADERTLKRVAEQVRDELSVVPGISQVQLAVARPYEISIEVSEEALQRHGLTFDEVARAVRRSSLDLPGGSLKTDAGEFQLRVKGQAYRGPEFEKLPLRTLPDGSRLLLGDVARVVDGFEDTARHARFNGKPAVVVMVFRTGNENALEMSRKVKEYVAKAQARMPAGVQLTPYMDYAQYLQSRLDLLLRNARTGFLLVFLLLALFLRLRLAFWVAVGIPISFLGTLWLMPALDVSISMITLFAFLLVLGIVVDDAIVVGENIYTHYQRGKAGLRAAIDGASEISRPVIFAVLTTIAAFVPLLAVEGNTGKIMRNIPLIVIPTLTFSLLECMLCVPNHLSHFRPGPDGQTGWHPFRRLQQAFARGLERFVQTRYTPFLKWCLQHRYVVAAIAASTLMLAAGLVAGGIVRFQFFPPVEGDDIAAFVTMPEGAAPEVVEAAVRQIEQAAEKLRAEYAGVRTTDGKPLFRHILSSIGDQPYRTAISRNGGRLGGDFARPNLGEVHIQLAPAETRHVTSAELVRRWRELTGDLPGAVELVFTSALFTTGDAINIQLTGPDVEQLRMAAAELKSALARYDGVLDIADSHRAGKPEIRLAIRPEAEALGLTLHDLARQVRQAFYGEEAQRIQRGRDDVRVMVRYPDRERRSLAALEHMRIRLPDGTEVPFSEVAEVRWEQGYASIVRVDRRRAINVTADVDLRRTTTDQVLRSLQQHELPALLGKYPGLRYSFEGQQREQQDTLRSLARGFLLALFLIFALIAIPLKSYIHPLVVMSAIPFGFVGAVLGHLIMGMMLTALSLFGLVALAGVAVNDGLVLVDAINSRRRAGVPLSEAVRQAGPSRFRAVLLTSLTTFAGLMPLILEKSVQARFLIPMAISLGFGILYCTFTTLILLPSAYLILEDLSGPVRRLFGWELRLETEEMEDVTALAGRKSS
jgi:multidrug efflux pump subunit AcrB